MLEPRLPALDLAPEIAALWDDLTAAVARVLRSGQFILGEEVRAFEAAMADYLGVRHAVAVASGTDALRIALAAAGVGPGDEVITTAFSFFATAEAISQCGATPVFADIDPVSFTLDPDLAAAAVTPRTRALLPVHLYGHAAAMAPLTALAATNGLRVIEDVAQACGARLDGRRLGSLGNAGCFSFFPSKNLGACGDGGLIATDDDALADAARLLRAHGARRKYHHEILGYNSRLDELQAAILRVKLPHLEAWNAARRRVASRYRVLLGGLPHLVLPATAPGVEHAWHQFTVRVTGGRRDAVQAALAAAGIDTAVYYPVPLHQLPVYAGLGYHLSAAEVAAAEVLSLPLWPDLAPAAQVWVASALRAALA